MTYLSGHSDGILVTGHRGAAGLAPENTIPSFEVARDLGCHSVELDVYLTRDDQLAVIHDDTIDRTTNGSGAVSSFTMEQLRSFDAGQKARIPTLNEVLELLGPTGMSVQIELKGPGTATPAATVVSSARFSNRVRFTSFEIEPLTEIRETLPTASVAILISDEATDPIQIAKSAGATHLHLPHRMIDRDIVENGHASGYPVVAFGEIIVPGTIDRLIEIGVDQIGSDRPDIVIHRLKKYGKYDPLPG